VVARTLKKKERTEKVEPKNNHKEEHKHEHNKQEK